MEKTWRDLASVPMTEPRWMESSSAFLDQEMDASVVPLDRSLRGGLSLVCFIFTEAIPVITFKFFIQGYACFSVGWSMTCFLGWRFRRQLSIRAGNLWALIRERFFRRRPPAPQRVVDVEAREPEEEEEEEEWRPRRPSPVLQLRRFMRPRGQYPVPQSLRVIPPHAAAGQGMEEVVAPAPLAVEEVAAPPPLAVEEVLPAAVVVEEQAPRRSSRRRLPNVRLLDYEWAGQLTPVVLFLINN